MIIAYIKPNAGMGNQMFMYAAGVATASRLGVKLRLGGWNYEHFATANRPYQLSCFPEITEPNASFSETFRICPGVAVFQFIYRKPIKISCIQKSYTQNSYIIFP